MTTTIAESTIDLKSTGVYKIQNIVNGKIYIGSAGSKRGFKLRYNSHFWELRKGKRCNSYLQNSFNRYGEENFIFVPLKECPKEECLEWEQFFLDLFQPEYNICKIAGSQLGVKRREEQVQKKRKTFLLINSEGRFVETDNLKN